MKGREKRKTRLSVRAIKRTVLKAEDSKSPNGTKVLEILAALHAPQQGVSS